MIKFYSSHCPKCAVLEEKMNNKKIEYVLIDNQEEILSKGKETGFTTLPLLEVDGKVMQFQDANSWVNLQ